MPARRAHAAISPLLRTVNVRWMFPQRLVNQIAEDSNYTLNPEARLFKTGESTTPPNGLANLQSQLDVISSAPAPGPARMGARAMTVFSCLRASRSAVVGVEVDKMIWRSRAGW
jgi:hypothetical protein